LEVKVVGKVYHNLKEELNLSFLIHSVIWLCQHI